MKAIPSAISQLWRVEYIAGLYLLLVWSLLLSRGMDFTFLVLLISYVRFVVNVSVVVAIVAMPMLFVRWRRRGQMTVGQDMEWLFRSMPALVLTLVAYTNLKVQLLQLNPRLYDQILARLDNALHFGLTQELVYALPEIGSPLLNGLMDSFYFLAWLAFALPLAVIWGRGDGSAVRRTLAALQLCYIIGGFLYLAFPALGPAFVQRSDFSVLAGGRSFGLQTEMIKALRYVVENPGAPAIPFFGIAAFPSLHLATSSLGMVAAWHHCRHLLILLVPWNLAIGFSTVYLGWHYAIDIYPGVLLAILCWYLAAKLQPAEKEPELQEDPG